ncbi:PhzF family phenazine biosynthesis protein [Aestuariirhabdus sp. Z084]|uniref:PhzF family phenazine biosynthesis protein n=1 Tax=Aestuariirhabdus haliotis TaxID=2918751 RepID=UPI00201B3709|nr:PhzF family phenazine biosynthesis protein [Aestuariirhabdus haliotis]MCL6416921.1 PhzF family phenazine biosynthesis protein [Aestuariirhabdus haliotis]MCL6420917.1 PhzF family phenazine biosynthesis protein [Aestuariirhabdus haliotis]
MVSGTLKRIAAFTTIPEGGNPAGVWVGSELPPVEQMQRMAAEVGFSETAFVAPETGAQRTIRFFSPEAEVPFCGHATIATGVALAQSDMAQGQAPEAYQLTTTVGEVPVSVTTTETGDQQATLVSVEPRYESAPEPLVTATLQALGWSQDELDESIPPARAYAGAWHLVLAVNSKSRLDRLQYDFETVKSLMLKNDLTTLQLVWKESDELFHSRNPFPVGGVVEDPATGAAAAAFGGYLREAKLISIPARLTLRQGEVMGRPSRIRVDIPETGGIAVSGAAVVMSLPE